MDGKYIQKLRLHMGLSQWEFGSRVGKTGGQVGLWENRKFTGDYAMEQLIESIAHKEGFDTYEQWTAQLDNQEEK